MHRPAGRLFTEDKGPIVQRETVHFLSGLSKTSWNNLFFWKKMDDRHSLTTGYEYEWPLKVPAARTPKTGRSFSIRLICFEESLSLTDNSAFDWGGMGGSNYFYSRGGKWNEYLTLYPQIGHRHTTRHCLYAPAPHQSRSSSSLIIPSAVWALQSSWP